MTKVRVTDAYGNSTEGTVTKVGRRYVYVTMEWNPYHKETVPFDRLTSRTSQGYEEKYNAMPMYIQQIPKAAKKVRTADVVRAVPCPSCFTIHAGECL